MGRRPKAIDLFAGAGGMSLGFEQAGFDVVAAVEIDPIHAATHHYNFPNTAAIPRTIIGLPSNELRRCAGLDESEPVVVLGGPPCQGFSLMGHRMLDDSRNQLVREFLRIVVELNASYFVFENVKGLTVGRQREFLDQLVEEFSRSGYCVAQPWHVLNAKDFGVPQDRKRLFLLGARQDLALPSYPAPRTFLREDLFGALSDSRTPTCYDALHDLPDIERFPELKKSDAAFFEKGPATSEYSKQLRCETSNAWHHGYRRLWDPNVMTSSLRTAHSDISRRRFSETAQGEVEPISRFFRLRANGISNTLRAGTDSARGAFTSPRPIHYKFPRCVSVREMARLHGYPDWFRFHVTKWHGGRQIGNSVPPPLARAVAEQVVRAIGDRPNEPRKPLTLGNPDLLRLGMKEAADFWNVDVPIRRRDRKSGARKRKQEEIEQDRMGIGRA